MKFRSGKSVGQKTVNLAGGEAFKQSPELELVSLLLTSFVKDKFYESGNDQLDRLALIVNKLADKKFAGQAAIYARNEFGMRSITHALIGEIVHIVKGQEWVKNAVTRTVKRPDDMLEMLGYFGSKHSDSAIPNSLKKGLRLAVGKFDAYQLTKYKSSRSDVKMVDLFNLVHPKPVDSRAADVYSKLINGELKNTETWEAKLSSAGQEVKEMADGADKEEKLSELKESAWQELLESKKLGYFALLRNLRNISQQAPKLIPLAIEQLLNKEAIQKSLVMPFRFQTAYKELDEAGVSRKLLDALNDATELSLSNVPKFAGKTLIVLDTSGSMQGDPLDIGSLFGAVLFKANADADLMTFDDDARYEKGISGKDSLLTIAEKLRKHDGGSTNFHDIFIKAKEKYDRTVILSDMQGWSGGYDNPTGDLQTYNKKFGADPFIYSFDLEGHGTLQFPENKIFCIAGWSDKILGVMALLEEDKNALVNKIKAIVL